MGKRMSFLQVCATNIVEKRFFCAGPGQRDWAQAAKSMDPNRLMVLSHWTSFLVVTKIATPTLYCCPIYSSSSSSKVNFLGHGSPRRFYGGYLALSTGSWHVPAGIAC